MSFKKRVKALKETMKTLGKRKNLQYELADDGSIITSRQGNRD